MGVLVIVISIFVVSFGVLFLLGILSQRARQGIAYRNPDEIVDEVQELLDIEEDKIEIIKFVREETGLGLKEAKDFVEGQEQYQAVDNTEIILNLEEMFHSGDSKVEMIKYLRGQTNLGLQEAKDFVEYTIEEIGTE